MKTAISIKIQPELLEQVDEQAKAEDTTRTAVFEDGARMWLKAASRRAKRNRPQD